MADFVKNFFGNAKPSAVPSDDDFADFAGAPDPSPASIIPSHASTGSAAIPTGLPIRPYTKWYRVWERTSPQDFIQEATILPFIIFVVAFHIWGRRKNKRIANNWATAHTPALQKEFAVVGFGTTPNFEDTSSQLPILREKTGQEFTSYATGRQNVAFLDIKLELFKRYNPATWFVEFLLSFFFESFKSPVERMEATAYSFDGREKDVVPVASQDAQEELDSRVKGLNSSHDGFVWAIVHKSHMRQLREDRYDLSLTYTRENDKLPVWATVMSESAEITNTLLTQDLVKAVEQAGESTFQYFIVSDQPVDKPTKLDETIPRKRVSLGLSLPSKTQPAIYLPSLPLFGYFLRFPDILVSEGRFRPEVLRKVRATREEGIKKLKRADEEEKAEERKAEADKKKKAERDAKLRLMSPDDQRKFLDKEREKDQRKMGKKQQVRG